MTESTKVTLTNEPECPIKEVNAKITSASATMGLIVGTISANYC
jgi:hypothetical protein